MLHPILFSPPPGPELSGFSPRPAGALPGAGEEFPREQLNSAPAKNSPGPGPKAGAGRKKRRRRRREGQALILPAPPLHLDPGPGLQMASSLLTHTNPFPHWGSVLSSLLPPLSFSLPSSPSLAPSGCLFSLYLPASDRARQRPVARTSRGPCIGRCPLGTWFLSARNHPPPTGS